jgi:hypothetical protein
VRSAWLSSNRSRAARRHPERADPESRRHRVAPGHGRALARTLIHDAIPATPAGAPSVSVEAKPKGIHLSLPMAAVRFRGRADRAHCQPHRPDDVDDRAPSPFVSRTGGISRRSSSRRRSRRGRCPAAAAFSSVWASDGRPREGAGFAAMFRNTMARCRFSWSKIKIRSAV